MKKRSMCYILLAVILLFAACGKKAQTWQELYDLGEKYLRKRLWPLPARSNWIRSRRLST